MYPLIANSVLVTHVCFVVFVILMVPLILIGGAKGWRWVRCPWLRGFHLAGIIVVAAQSWAGIVCPLTTLEVWLRKQGGETAYTRSFIEYWLKQLLYWDAPSWMFVAAYTVFAIVVISTWFFVPPRSSGVGHARSR